MKLNKKTIYRVKTQEAYDKLMKDAEEQGYKWFSGNKPTELDYWNIEKENTAIYLDEDGNLTKGEFDENDLKKPWYTGYSVVDYEIKPEIYPINFGCVGIDAPDFKTAYEEFRKHMLNIFGDKSETNTYTVRVDDNKTTVITPDGKVATAKCHPDDAFDVVEGFRVALEKIEEQNRKLTQKEKDILNAIIMLGGYSFYIDEDHDLNVEFKDESICIDIDDDVFKWCELFDDYDPKELLEKYA